VTQSFRGVPILDAILPKVMDIVEKQPTLARAIWTRVPPELALRAALLSRDVDPERVRSEDMLPYLKHMTHVDFPMFLKMLRAAGEHSAEEYLPKIDVPVLVVAGEKDTFTPSSLSKFMVESVPGAEMLMVEGGTHVAPIEQPELIGAKIKAFVERAAAR
jgi:pimeloyl-ACP methyl ester carboxylesterase